MNRSVTPTPLGALLRRVDDVGIIEHARRRFPDPELGHCTDDAGRGLGMAARLSPNPMAVQLATACLNQLDASLRFDGTFTLRLDAQGLPTRDPPSDDAHARAIWGLSLATIGDLPNDLTRRAQELLDAVALLPTPHPRAAAQSVLAGTQLVGARPECPTGHRLIEVYAPALLNLIGRKHARWRWPEARLTYSNGLIVDGLLALADVSGDRALLTEGLDLLEWLVQQERLGDDHFSFTPVGGREPGEPGGFDQQPIEAWTLADAAARAYGLTGDVRWCRVCRDLVRWFDGANDRRARMWDPYTGAAFDGLTPSGPNGNQGAESTMALVATTLARATTAQRRGTTAPPSGRLGRLGVARATEPVG